MVEFVVVVFFGIMVLSGAGGAIDKLIETMQNSYRGYTYAVSLSELPNYADVVAVYDDCIAKGGSPDFCKKLVDSGSFLDEIEDYVNKFNDVKGGLALWKNPPNIDPLDYYEPPDPKDIFCIATGLC